MHAIWSNNPINHQPVSLPALDLTLSGWLPGLGLRSSVTIMIITTKTQPGQQ